MRDKLKIAHISDVHFSKICYSPFQFFSKRWLGNANLLLKRGRAHSVKKVTILPEMFKKLGVTDLFITGDLTTTSQHSEFKLAKELITAFEEMGIRVLLIPGNHDNYTRFAEKQQRFFQHLSQTYPSKRHLDVTLKDDKVCAFKLENGWWVVALDTTLSLPLHLSGGRYTEAIDQTLRATLEKIPSDEPIILVNHFPFFQHEPSKRRMEGGALLETLMRETPNIKFYLHGHTHRRCMADLRSDNLPIVIDSGSVSHKTHGSWNLINLEPKSASVSVYLSNDTIDPNWRLSRTETFDFVV